jgi:histidine triad (HIT) family protein
MVDNCIFCSIVEKNIPAEIVYEDEAVMAFNDINPKAKIHIIIIPKKHISSLTQVTDEDVPVLGKMIFSTQALAKEKGIGESGFKTVINTGPDGGQVVEHIHVHLLGGEPLHGIT